MFYLLRVVTLFCTLVFSWAEVSAVEEASVASTEVPPQKIILPMHPNANDLDSEDYYFTRLLKLALDKTRSTDGDYRTDEAQVWLTDNRLKAALKSGHLDVIWSNSSPEFERSLLPVRVSLFKELGDYRVLIIRPGEQHRFNEVQSLADLRLFSGGVGSQWRDLAVMRANDLPVVTSPGYGRLFRMLAAGRFDYFSRGLYQVRHEVDFYPELGLIIEDRLMLHYPSPYYFFVRQGNQALADRLRRGLLIAQADGSFDRLFYSIPRHQWAQDQLRKGHRHVIPLVLPETEPVAPPPDRDTARSLGALAR